MPLCPEVGELLSRYAADAALPEEVAAAEAHLGQCAVCQAEVERLRKLDGILRQDGTNLGQNLDAAAFTGRLKARLQASSAASRGGAAASGQTPAVAPAGADERTRGVPAAAQASRDACPEPSRGAPSSASGNGKPSKEDVQKILKQDRLVGQIALQASLASKEDLQRAVQILKNLKASGEASETTLAQVLLKEGILSKEHLKRIVEIACDSQRGAPPAGAAAAAASSGGGSGAVAAVSPAPAAAPEPPPAAPAAAAAPAASGALGSDASPSAAPGVTEEDVILGKLLIERGLVTQSAVKEVLGEKKAQNLTMPMGQILVKRRQLDVRDYLAVVQERKDRVVTCACGTYNIARPDQAGKTIACRKCGAPVAIPVEANRWGSPSSAGHTRPIPGVASASANASAPGVLGAATADLRRPGEASADALPVEESSVPPGFASGILFGQGDVLRQFGPYEIVEEIARGGMGIVYKAKQKDLNRFVALKVLKEGEGASEKQIRRFRRETEAAAKLQHPNIVAVHEVGVYKGYHYFTMDLIEGKPLDQVIQEGALTMEERLEILEEICRAIDYAHEQGIVHRDLKPANVILDKLGHPKITDFGLAKSIDSDSVLTKTGAAVGTPFYMPPEQARGDIGAIDRRCDVYALGVIMYELMTNKLPFTGETTLEVYHKILDQDPIPPSKHNKKVDLDLETICLKAMEKEIKHRFDTALQMAIDLRHWLDGEPIEAKAVGRVGYLWRRMRRSWPETLAAGIAALIFISSLVVMGYMWMRRRSDDHMTRVSNDYESYRSRVDVAIREAEAALNLGTASAAERKYREAVERFREGADRILALPEIPSETLEFPQENLERAQAYLTEVGTKTNEVLRDLRFSEGDALFQVGTEESFDQAIACFEEASRLDPRFARAFLRRSEVETARRNYDQALALLSQAITLDPRFDEAYIARGRIFDRQGIPLRAAEDYTQVVQRYRDAPPASDEEVQRTREQLLTAALLARAASYLANGDTDEALADASFVLENIDGDCFDGRLIKGQILEAEAAVAQPDQAASTREQAAGEYRYAIDLRFSRPQGYYRLGMLQLSERKYEEAISNFEKAVERDPDYFPAHLAMGIARAARLEYDEAIESLERIIRSPRREARDLLGDAYYQLGRVRRIRGERPEALDAFARAVENAPSLAAAHLDRGLLLAEEGNIEAARQSLARAKEISSFDPGIDDAQGRVEMMAGDAPALERAQALLAEAQRQNPNSAQFNTDLACLWVLRGNDGRARTFFRQALEIEERALDADYDPVDDATFFFMEGERRHLAALSSGKPEDIAAALGYFERAIDLAPRYAHAHLSRGEILRMRGEVDGALAAFERATQVNPYLVDAWVALGNVMVDRGSHAQAIEAFDRAVRLDNSCSMAFFGRSRARMESGDPEQAIADLHEATECNPDYAEAYDLLARIHDQRGNTAEADAARREHERIMEERRALARQHLQEGMALHEQRRYTEAIRKFEDAIALDPTLHEAYYQRGLANIKIGELVSAVLDFSQALELYPRYVDEFYEKVYRVSFVMDLSHIMNEINDLVESHPNASHVVFLRGFFYVAKIEFQRNQPGDEERGIADFNRALELNPNHVAALLYRGYLFLLQGRRDDAMTDFDRAMALDPTLGVVHYFRASAFAQQGDTETCFNELAAAFERGFNGYDRVRANPAFEPYRTNPRYVELMGNDPGTSSTPGLPGFGGGDFGAGGIDPNRLRELMGR